MDMNHSILIVKVIAPPKQSFVQDSIPVTEILVKFPTIKQKKNCNDIFTISIWGNLSYDALKNYSISKYIVIEGYISIYDNILTLQNSQKIKQIKISVSNMYPYY